MPSDGMTTMSEKQPRPGQTTLAGSVIIAGSVVVVLSAWQRISGLGTLEVQEEFERILGDAPLSGIGWSVDDLATVVRILCLVGAGAATASTVLGVQVFKRSTSARVALTVLAPLLLVAGVAINGFFAPMVAAAIAMLWLQPTRDWYAGRPWMQRYEQRRYEQRRSERAAALRQANPRASGEEDPDSGGAAPSAQEIFTNAPNSAHLPSPPVGGGTPGKTPGRTLGRAQHRPPRLVSVCVVTWVVSGLVVLGLGVMAAVVPSQAEDLLDQVRKDQPELFKTYDPTTTDLLVGLYIMIGVLIVWAVIAAVLAWLAFAGHNWARITLAVSAFCAAVLALFVSVGAWPLVLLVAAFAGSGWVLLRPEVAAWYRR